MNISVIICTYNRCESLKDTLGSLLVQKCEKIFEHEIIVVDNNSKDKTKEVVQSYLSAFGGRLRYIFEPEQGLSYARNRGVREARGQIIAFTDDDCIVEKSWVANISNAFNTYNPAIVGGKVILKLTIPTPKWLSEKLVDILGAYDRGDDIVFLDNHKENSIGIGANICFKKSTLDKVGLFRVDLGRKGNSLCMGEETELIRRIKKQGGKCMYYPFAIVYHCGGANKMKKSYIIRWFFKMGEWQFFSDKMKSDNADKQIFGISRWRYKKAVIDAISIFWFAVRGAEDEAFYRCANVFHFLGYCTHRYKYGRRKTDCKGSIQL